MNKLWERAICSAAILGTLLILYIESPIASGHLFLLTIVYLLVRRLKYHIAVCGLVVSLVFSILPLLGLGSGTFLYPNADIPLKTFNIEPPIVLRSLPKFLYRAAELPLQLATLVPGVSQIVYFPGEGVASVQPYFVFVFWFSMSITIGISLMFRMRA